MPCRLPYRSFPFCRPLRVLVALAISAPALPVAAAAPSSSAGCISNVIVTSSADSGTGTLRPAVAGLCNGGRIRFANSAVIELASEIAIDKQVTIDGSSMAQDASAGDAALVWIRGRSGVRSFRVSAAGDLTLRSLRISDGATADLGGGVRSSGRLAVFDSRLDHNTAGNSGGFGGLFAFGADTTLINSVFADNTGTQCGISGGTVAAIALLAPGAGCQSTVSGDPRLAPLAANGGSTMTHALVEGDAAECAIESRQPAR